MPVNKYFLLRALLQYNYFPGQKKAIEVLPPILNTENFKLDTFKKILTLAPAKPLQAMWLEKISQLGGFFVRRELRILKPLRNILFTFLQ